MASSHFTPFTLLTPEKYTLQCAIYSAVQPIAELILLHGLAEHFRRYEPFIQALTSAGVTVYTYDMRGHGRSGGPRASVRSFQEYTDDLHLFTSSLAPGSLPRFLMGHSMGSLVAVTWLTSGKAHDVAGFISSSGALKVSEHISPFLRSISGVLSAIVPTLPTIQLEAAAISRDTAVVTAYQNDPLVWRKGIRSRLGHELIQATQAVSSRFASLSMPMLVFHGTADRLADIEGSKSMFLHTSSADKECLWVEDGYHELLNDYGREDLTKYVINWLKHRI